MWREWARIKAKSNTKMYCTRVYFHLRTVACVELRLCAAQNTTQHTAQSAPAISVVPGMGQLPVARANLLLG
ncbi:hypothetical protein ACLKA7_015722 [Drosophila subpalustris]